MDPSPTVPAATSIPLTSVVPEVNFQTRNHDIKGNQPMTLAQNKFYSKYKTTLHKQKKIDLIYIFCVLWPLLSCFLLQLETTQQWFLSEVLDQVKITQTMKMIKLSQTMLMVSMKELVVLIRMTWKILWANKVENKETWIFSKTSCFVK